MVLSLSSVISLLLRGKMSSYHDTTLLHMGVVVLVDERLRVRMQQIEGKDSFRFLLFEN